jgi:hypothetical protein
MGEKTDQIERHIREQRNDLGQNISELQQKVRNSVDWRLQFEHRPMTMIGLAVGSGLLLSALVGSRSRARNFNRISDQPTWVPERTPSKPYREDIASEKTAESFREIKAALIGVTAAKLGDVIETVLPGFKDEYDKLREVVRPIKP